MYSKLPTARFPMPPFHCVKTITVRDGSAHGSGRRPPALTTLKMAVVRPRPRAGVIAAAAVNPAWRRLWRSAKRTSCRNSRCQEFGRDHRREPIGRRKLMVDVTLVTAATKRAHVTTLVTTLTIPKAWTGRRAKGLKG